MHAFYARLSFGLASRSLEFLQHSRVGVLTAYRKMDKKTF